MGSYNPGNPPNDPKELAQYLILEQEKIAQAISSPNEQLDLRTLYAEPKKFRDGTIAKADGATWNPGSGAGVYCYYGAAWHFLG